MAILDLGVLFVGYDLWSVCPFEATPRECPQYSSIMDTCSVIVTMSLFVAPAMAPIYPPFAPARPTLALTRVPRVLMIVVLPTGASGAFLYKSPFPFCERARGDLGGQLYGFFNCI